MRFWTFDAESLAIEIQIKLPNRAIESELVEKVAVDGRIEACGEEVAGWLHL